jgi:arylsulfatase A-like enzyme
VTDAALEKVAVFNQPFYLYLHYLDPHGPYYPPDAYRAIFGPLPEWTYADRAALDPKRQMPYLLTHINQMFGKAAAQAFEPMTEAGKETMRIWYDAECRYTDDEVSRLVESIRASHPDTLFVFTSDHGEEFWEHQGMGHGTTLYQEQVRVPLFIVGPNVAPAVIDQPVDTLSIFNTLASYLGQSAPIPPRGENLLGPAPSGTAYTRTKGPTSDIPIDLEAALQGQRKGIRNKLTQTTTAYDLATDPAEQQPLPDPAATDQMNTLLNTHADENKSVRPNRIQSEQVELTPEKRQQLLDLGYEVK